MMNPLGQQKLNNSYESEQSSSNGVSTKKILRISALCFKFMSNSTISCFRPMQSINEAPETSSMPLSLPELFAVDRINTMELNGSDKCIKTSATEFNYDSELTQYSNTFSSAEISDQNERVFKELDKIKLTKILKTLTTINQPSEKCVSQPDFYDRNIDKSPAILFTMENSCNASDSKIVERNSTKKCDRNLSFKLDIESNSRRFRASTTKKTPVRRLEQSPDLFDDSDDPDHPNGQDVTTIAVLERSLNKDVDDKSKTIGWEKILLKRLQNSLLGVLPPPSKTIIQYSSTELLDLYNENLLKLAESTDAESNPTESLFKPTHTVDEAKTIEWSDMKWDIKCHGLLYNRTTDSEDIELLCMKYLDRCVGVETSSSFTHTYRQSANKARMKLLSQSPGTRLSHLVGRRKGLASTSLLSKQWGSDSSKLGSKQLVIDVQ